MPVSDKEYIDNQINWMLKLYDAEFKSVREAVKIYNETNNDWKQTHNNLQRQMKEQESTFVTRKELWVAVFAIIGAVTAILGLILKS